VRGLATVDERQWLGRVVRLRVPMGDAIVVTRLVHGVVDVRRRGQRQERQRNDENGTKAANRRH
jgi:hypothetical protein